MNTSSKIPSDLIALLALLLLSAAGYAQDAPPTPSAQDTLGQPPQRDPVGDLNAAAVRAGVFPGAIVLPGTNVSLAIGGFIKTVAISDSDLEGSGANLLPGTFGASASGDGNFAVDATLSRLYFDGRAPVEGGRIRGYLEWDFNARNNGSLDMRPRLAFATWQTGAGTLLAGHNWSAFMDLKLIPESLTEPTVSGAIFTRQAQLRWTQRFSAKLHADFSLEDPNVADLLSQEEGVGKTLLPDFVAGVEIDDEAWGHLRAGGILRRLESREADGESTATGWGVTLGGYVNVAAADRLALSGSYGQGIARYMVGNGPRAGGIVDPLTGEVHVLENYGGLVTYRHAWNERTRTSAAFGHARAEVRNEQPGDAFRSTSYGYINVMYSPQPYLTMGAEYAYARLEVKDGSITDDHRVALGVQIY